MSGVTWNVQSLQDLSATSPGAYLALLHDLLRVESKLGPAAWRQTFEAVLKVPGTCFMNTTAYAGNMTVAPVSARHPYAMPTLFAQAIADSSADAQVKVALARAVQDHIGRGVEWGQRQWIVDATIDCFVRSLLVHGGRDVDTVLHAVVPAMSGSQRDQALSRSRSALPESADKEMGWVGLALHAQDGRGMRTLRDLSDAGVLGPWADLLKAGLAADEDACHEYAVVKSTTAVVEELLRVAPVKPHYCAHLIAHQLERANTTFVGGIRTPQAARVNHGTIELLLESGGRIGMESQGDSWIGLMMLNAANLAVHEVLTAAPDLTRRCLRTTGTLRTNAYFDVSGLTAHNNVEHSEELASHMRKTVRALIEAGCDLDNVDHSGKDKERKLTAIQRACTRGYLELARILVEEGLDPDVKSGTGRSTYLYVIPESERAEFKAFCAAIKARRASAAAIEAQERTPGAWIAGAAP